jgi:hypothetical protein
MLYVYDWGQTEQPRNPIWVQQSVPAFERAYSAMGDIDKRAMKYRVSMDDGSGLEPLDEAIEQCERMWQQV